MILNSIYSSRAHLYLTQPRDRPRDCLNRHRHQLHSVSGLHTPVCDITSKCRLRTRVSNPCAHTLTGTQIHPSKTQTHTQTQTQSRAINQTCADSFTFAFWDSVLDTAHQHVGEFLWWCVLRQSHLFGPHTVIIAFYLLLPILSTHTYRPTPTPSSVLAAV